MFEAIMQKRNTCIPGIGKIMQMERNTVLVIQDEQVLLGLVLLRKRFMDLKQALDAATQPLARTKKHL